MCVCLCACASADGPVNWSMITTAYTPRPLGHLYRSHSFCSSLCLSTIPLNTCYYCTAEPSKAWCANTPVLTGGYKMTEGHRILWVYVFWMPVCVWNRYSHFLESVIWVLSWFKSSLSLFVFLREVEGELEVVWEAATRESQRLREVVLGSSSLSPATVAPALRSTSGQTPARIPCVEDHLSCSLPPPFTSRQNRLPHPLQRSPMFDSDSDQHQNPSSDESEKSRRD